MITEKMLEFLILRGIKNDMCKSESFDGYINYNYDIQKIFKRYEELGKEFLEPYIKTSTSRED